MDGLERHGVAYRAQGERTVEQVGQVIDPSVGFLIAEADYGTRQWRVRQLATDSTAVFEYYSNDLNKTEERLPYH